MAFCDHDLRTCHCHSVSGLLGAAVRHANTAVAQGMMLRDHERTVGRMLRHRLILAFVFRLDLEQVTCLGAIQTCALHDVICRRGLPLERPQRAQYLRLTVSVKRIGVPWMSGSVAYLKSAENGPYTGAAGSSTVGCATGEDMPMSEIPPP